MAGVVPAMAFGAAARRDGATGPAAGLAGGVNIPVDKKRIGFKIEASLAFGLTTPWLGRQWAGDGKFKPKEKLMAKYRILRSYQGLPAAALGELALHVATSLTSNANFITPTILPAALTGMANGFLANIAAAVDGNKQATATKNAAQAALIAALDQLADYIELNGQNNPAKMLSSGLSLASTSNAPVSPGRTNILAVSNVATTKLKLDLTVADHARCYVVQISSAPGVWVIGGVFTDPHDAVLTGLTPGTTYAIRVGVMGSGNQLSEWCDTVSRMST